jgi:hypothetical protein
MNQLAAEPLQHRACAKLHHYIKIKHHFIKRINRLYNRFSPYAHQTQAQIKLTFYSKTAYHHAATRMVDSAEMASAGTPMKISAKMNIKR